MTMDESGDDCAPQVVCRFNVSDCSDLQPITSAAAERHAPSSWAILQRDTTFGAGWPSAFYARVFEEGAEPLFTITPPPIETRMHFVMEGIFAAVVVPEYAQLMGINLRKPPANADGRGDMVVVDDYKYIPVTASYSVAVLSSFVLPAPATPACPSPPPCSLTAASSATSQQTCESTAPTGSGRRAVATLITSDSYLQGALLLLYVRPLPRPSLPSTLRSNSFFAIFHGKLCRPPSCFRCVPQSRYCVAWLRARCATSRPRHRKSV